MADSVLDEWAVALAQALDLDAGDVPIEALLDVARDAAHGVTRPAAPLATYLVGYAVALGMPVDEACERASAAAQAWPGGPAA